MAFLRNFGYLDGVLFVAQKLYQYKKQALHADKDREKAVMQADEYHTALLKATHDRINKRNQIDENPTCDGSYASQLAALKSRHKDYIDASQRTKLAK